MMKGIQKKLLLYCFVLCSEATKVRREIGYNIFPNFRSVYHGHGATSYQNVQIENHGSVPIPTSFKHVSTVEYLPVYNEIVHHAQPTAVLGTEAHIVEHYIDSTAAPDYEDHFEHVTIEEAEITPHHHHQHYDHKIYDYN